MTTKNWYFEVNEYCKTLSELHNISLVKVAGIMSALSPNNTFKTNVASLEKFLKTGGNCKVTTFNDQKEKALTIYHAHDNISIDEVKEILGGLKTMAFFDNIVRPATSRDVTVDLWMIRWAKIEGSLTPKRYREVSEKITAIADSLGLMPHQVQAGLWVEIRGKAW